MSSDSDGAAHCGKNLAEHVVDLTCVVEVVGTITEHIMNNLLCP